MSASGKNLQYLHFVKTVPAPERGSRVSNLPQAGAPGRGPIFEERPTELVVRDAYWLGAAPLALAGLFGALDLPLPGMLCLAATLFVAASSGTRRG